MRRRPLIPTMTKVSDPAAEPLTLAEVKDHLRRDSTAEDARIRAYLRSARALCENFTRRQLVRADWRLTLDEFPERIEVPRPPLASVTSIKYTDTDNNEKTLAASKYKVASSEYGAIVEADGETWPTTLDQIDAVRVDFTAGYAPSDDSPTDHAANVPEPLKDGMKLLIEHWFDVRAPVTVGSSASEVPWTIDALWRPYVDPRFY